MQITVLRGPLATGPFTLRPGDNIAGRSGECEVCLPSKRVSRHHCVFTVGDGRVDVRDLGSHNGIVDGNTGRRVASMALLPGCCVQIGDYLLMLDEEAPWSEPPPEDDDVMIATAEIEGPILDDLPEAELHWAGNEEEDEDFDEELSLDDTASAIRAASLSPGLRPPPPRERTQPSAPRPLAEVAPLRRPQPLPAQQAANYRGESARSGWRATNRADNTAPRLELREEPAARPALLPVEDLTPRQLPRPLSKPAEPRAPQPSPAVLRPARPAADARPAVEPRLPADPPAARGALPRAESRPAQRLEPRAVTPGPVSQRPLPQSQASQSQASQAQARQAQARQAQAPRAPMLDPAETRATGVPWLLQVVFLLMVTLAVVVCAPVGGLASQVRTQAALAHDAAVRQAVETARVLAARNATELDTGTGATLDLSLVAGNPGVRDARLCDTRGTVLAPADKARLSLGTHGAMARAMATGAAATAETDTGTVEVVVPIRTTASGPVVGYAWLDYDPDVVASSLANPWLGAFATVLVAGALWSMLLALVWWTAMRPASALAHTAERLASGRTSAVSPPTRSDSWERIARSLNELAARARERNEG